MISLRSISAIFTPLSIFVSERGKMLVVKLLDPIELKFIDRLHLPKNTNFFLIITFLERNFNSFFFIMNKIHL